MTTPTTLTGCLGQRVLVSVFDGPPRMTVVSAFSPSHQFVWLRGDGPADENIGWNHVAHVRVLESLQPSTGTVKELIDSLEPAGSVSVAVPSS